MLRRRLVDWLHSVWYAQTKPPMWLRVLVPIYKSVQAKQSQMPNKPTGEKLDVPVIVVGNLVVGGSGKTPVVARLVTACCDAGYQVAVISRGYGSKVQTSDKSSIDLATATSDPGVVGDEPVLLAHLTGVNIWVGRDRRRALEHAVAAGAEVVISDDGLQHPGLQSTYALCLIDGNRGLGNGYLLPAGPLRESIERLDSVDHILIKDGGFHLSQPHSHFELLPLDLIRLSDGAIYGLDMLKGESIQGACAIANPESFRLTLKKLGAKVHLLSWPDHHAFSSADLINAYQERPMVITQKDWVKVARLTLPLSLRENIYVLRVRAELPSEVVNAVIAHVRELKAHG